MLVGVCEDDASIRRLVAQALRYADHEVLAAHDGGEALRLFGTDSGVDVVVMDVGLPDSDGRDVVQALRSAGQSAPVLFLTALGAVHDRLAGFHAGGDDYVAKPFDVQELIARVEALGRRGRPATPATDGLVLDPSRHGVRAAGGEVLLTPTEYRMLAAITSRPGRGRPPPDGRRRGLARRGSGQREHHRLVHPPDPGQARLGRLAGHHRDRARRRVPAHVSPPLPTGSFQRQIVVLTACVTAFAMVVLALVLQLILAAQTARDVDRVLEDRADAVVGSTTTRGSDGGLVVPDADLDQGVVVYDAEGTAVAGTVSPSLQATYAELSTVDRVEHREVDEATRVRAAPFRTSSGTRGVVVVAERLTPYEEAERYALLVSLATGLLATSAAAAIAAWVTRRALRPVAVLAATAADWSEHDLGRRFDLGPPTNELTSLAEILDTLLDKVSVAIHAEQRLTSELAHELRTPLTAIQGTADLALMRRDLDPDLRADLEEVAAAARRMATTITTLLHLARSDESVLAASSCSLAEVVDEVLRATPAGDLAVRLDQDTLEHRLGMPHELAVRALAPLVANAVRFARSRVTVSATTDVGGGGGVGRGRRPRRLRRRPRLRAGHHRRQRLRRRARPGPGPSGRSLGRWRRRAGQPSRTPPGSWSGSPAPDRRPAPRPVRRRSGSAVHAAPMTAVSTATTERPAPVGGPAPVRAGGHDGWVVLAAAVLAGVVRLPYLAAPLSSDEGGFLMVAAQWSPGTSLYGDYWVDRPPLLVMLFGLADDLGGTVALRLIGVVAVVAAVVAAGRIGSLVAHPGAPSPRSALRRGPGRGHGGGLPGEPAVRDEGGRRRAAGAAPRAALDRLLPEPPCGATAAPRARRRAWLLGAGAAAAAAVLVKQNLVDGFVFAAVALVTVAVATRRRGERSCLRRDLASLTTGAAVVTLVVLLVATRHGTSLPGLWDAVVTFRFDAASVIDTSASAATGDRLRLLLGALALSGAPLLVLLLLHDVRRLRPRAPAAPDLRWPVLALLAWEVASLAGGGSYWLHYLLCLVPGLVLAAALLARRRPVLLRLVLGGCAAVTAVAVTVVAVRAPEHPPRTPWPPGSPATTAPATPPWSPTGSPTSSRTPGCPAPTRSCGACRCGCATPTSPRSPPCWPDPTARPGWSPGRTGCARGASTPPPARSRSARTTGRWPTSTATSSTSTGPGPGPDPHPPHRTAPHRTDTERRQRHAAHRRPAHPRARRRRDPHLRRGRQHRGRPRPAPPGRPAGAPRRRRRPEPRRHRRPRPRLRTPR